MSRETEHDTETIDEQAAPAEGAADASGQDSADRDAGVLVELEEERRRVRELEEQVLRRAAEFQNYRRRTQDDLAFAAERGRAEVVLRMIEVLDDLRRSREAAESAAETQQSGPLFDSLKQGVDLVYKKLQDALAAFGVQEIDAVGQPFDERLHEAMMQQDAPDQPSGTVVGEVQKGYTMGDRVLRHAQVVVAQ